MRIDKFLKVSRVIKRRTIANEACDAGRVLINDKVIKASAEVKVGDIVEVLSQPLEGYTGQVEEINKDKGKVRVLITMFGRETSVELDFANIQKASK